MIVIHAFAVIVVTDVATIAADRLTVLLKYVTMYARVCLNNESSDEIILFNMQVCGFFSKIFYTFKLIFLDSSFFKLFYARCFSFRWVWFSFSFLFIFSFTHSFTQCLVVVSVI